MQRPSQKRSDSLGSLSTSTSSVSIGKSGALRSNTDHRACRRTVGFFIFVTFFYVCVLSLFRPDDPRLTSVESKVVPAFVGEEGLSSSQATSAVNVLSRGLPQGAQILRSKSAQQCKNTLVMAYFKLRSKYKSSEYDKWMKNSLSLEDCLVVFTETEFVPQIREHRQHALNRTVIVTMTLDSLPIASLRQENANFWQNQLSIDHEKRRHKSYQLFWIWLSKTWFVHESIQHNWFKSDFFMYSDIGSFRRRSKYNGKIMIQHPEIVPAKKIAWLAHHKPDPPSTYLFTDKFRQKKHFFHSGSQAAGSLEAWKSYHTAFSRTLDDFVAKGLFIGEDQCVLQGTCQRYPNLCAYIPFTQVNDNHYFGLRFAMHHGGNFHWWFMPGARR